MNGKQSSVRVPLHELTQITRYHTRCLKIARGKVKEDDDFVCPICDHRVKIPRDAARPKLEEMASLQNDIPGLPFQPDEEETIASIVDTAQAFRDEMQPFIHQIPVMATTDDVPIMRFYLRKIEGADILLAEETNHFKQELHRFCPIAPNPPEIIDFSSSTRKPRPTKQQKLMAQHGVDNPDDLPQHLRSKPYNMGRRKERDEDKTKQKGQKIPRPPQGPHAPGYTKNAQPARIPPRVYPYQSHKNGGPGAGSSQVSFKPPLTATAFPQYHNQDNRLARGPGDPLFLSNSVTPGSVSGNMGSLGSPINASGESPASQNANLDPGLFDAPNSAGMGGFMDELQRPESADLVEHDGELGSAFINGTEQHTPAATNMFSDENGDMNEANADQQSGAMGEGGYDDNSMFADLTNQDDGQEREDQRKVTGEKSSNGGMVDPALL